MGITVDHQYFETDEDALKEIEEQGYYSSIFDAPPSGGTPIHWHDVSIRAYITSGKFRFQDPASGEVHECVEGTRFVIPERTLHIEEEHHGYRAVIGLSKQELEGPFVRPPEELEG